MSLQDAKKATTAVELRRELDIPFSAAADYVSEFFKEHARLKVHGPARDATVSTGFRVVDDTTDASRIHDAVIFAWSPKLRFLPDLAATLRVRPNNGRALLMLNAMYDPPFGRAGAAFDRIAGQRIANRTFVALLNDIEVYVLSHYASEAARSKRPVFSSNSIR